MPYCEEDEGAALQRNLSSTRDFLYEISVSSMCETGNDNDGIGVPGGQTVVCLRCHLG